MTNQILREHVTSIGFNLTLSKAQIAWLVVLHHFKGDMRAISDAGFSYHPSLKSSVATRNALGNRGLIGHKLIQDNKGYVVNAIDKPTRAGNLVVGLLKESGIYQERLTELLDSAEFLKKMKIKKESA